MENKHLFAYAVLFAVIIAGFLYFYKPQQEPQPAENQSRQNGFALDPLNATYMIEEDAVILKNGRSEIADAFGTVITSVWDRNPAKGDLNSDGIDDAALIIIYDPGGSGTFFYAVAALSDPKNNKTVGTNGIFLGDRVAPQNVSIKEGEILINYADRRADDPMTAQPSIGISKYFKVMDSKLVEITKTPPASAVPQGYSQDDYSVEKVQIESFCEIDAECTTPPEYLIQSRCPFTSRCLYNKCVVVCPAVQKP